MYMNHTKISKGITLYLKPTGNAAWHWDGVLYSGTVSKIGKKYFYVTLDRYPYQGEIKFSKETGQSHCEDYNSGYVLYQSVEQYEYERVRAEMLKEIRGFFDGYCFDALSGEAVRAIHRVLRNEGVIVSDCEDVISEKKNCPVCGCQMVWEHPDIPSLMLTSSCYEPGFDLCHECLVEHCIQTNCLQCTLQKYPDCRFIPTKNFYLQEKENEKI